MSLTWTHEGNEKRMTVCGSGLQKTSKYECERMKRGRKGCKDVKVAKELKLKAVR